MSWTVSFNVHAYYKLLILWLLNFIHFIFHSYKRSSYFPCNHLQYNIRSYLSPNPTKLIIANHGIIFIFLWKFIKSKTNSVQFSSTAQSFLTLCDPMECSIPGFPVHHQLLEFTQTHVHWVGDAIQPSHPLVSTSPPTFNHLESGYFPMSQFFA